MARFYWTNVAYAAIATPSFCASDFIISSEHFESMGDVMRYWRGIHASLVAAGFAAIVLVSQGAQAASGVPVVVDLPIGSAPPPPAGMKVACMTSPTSGYQPSKTCPVVQANGLSVWAFSYSDNRSALGLVTYGPGGNIVSSISKPGTRYIWEAISSAKTQSVQFFGQSDSWVSATWAELKLQ